MFKKCWTMCRNNNKIRIISINVDWKLIYLIIRNPMKQNLVVYENPRFCLMYTHTRKPTTLKTKFSHFFSLRHICKSSKTWYLYYHIFQIQLFWLHTNTIPDSESTTVDRFPARQRLSFSTTPSVTTHLYRLFAVWWKRFGAAMNAIRLGRLGVKTMGSIWKGRIESIVLR